MLLKHIGRIKNLAVSGDNKLKKDMQNVLKNSNYLVLEKQLITALKMELGLKNCNQVVKENDLYAVLKNQMEKFQSETWIRI